MRSFSLIRWELGGGFEVVAVGIIAGGGDLSRRPQGGVASVRLLAAQASTGCLLDSIGRAQTIHQTSDVSAYGRLRLIRCARQLRQALEFARLGRENRGDNAVGGGRVGDGSGRKAELRKHFGS